MVLSIRESLRTNVTLKNIILHNTELVSMWSFGYKKFVVTLKNKILHKYRIGFYVVISMRESLCTNVTLKNKILHNTELVYMWSSLYVKVCV